MATVFTPVVLTDAPTDWGPMHIAVAASGVVATALLSSSDAFRAGLARRGFAAADEDAVADSPVTAMAIGVRELLEAALAGSPVDLSDVTIDLGDRPAWDRLVLAAVRAIPRGQTASYGEIARRIGRAGAARAVGGAVGRNPIGVLVPCHRVIAADGSLGGYGAAAWGGVAAALELKRSLLRLEGVEVAVSAG